MNRDTQPQTAPLLQVAEVECRYGNQRILQKVSFSLAPGEIACLLGPSGCGKTTLLHAIAGFQPIANGAIELEGRTLSQPGSTVPPEKRQVGVVFQDYALFPHLTVAENIAFGLKAFSKEQRNARVTELLQLIRMAQYGQQYPHQLSGGQQQRVALARALAPRPKLLLMDEPFSNLDTELRRSLAAEVRRILQKENLAAIVVTHDREEAFVVGDKLGVLAGGALQQWDSPQAIYHQPATLAVAKVIERGNLLEGNVSEGGFAHCALGDIPLPEGRWLAGQPVAIFVRHSDLIRQSDAVGAGAARVLEKYFLGDHSLYRLQLASGELLEASFSGEVKVGQEIFVRPQTPLVYPAH
ncbi:ABC transporter ATP-binding protein [Microbulbifer sp. SA54]|uniref:ABC transporter ATP-binding protein n=1 Tax=Microbulbifer sp. SA54 TaxID=3401577 RepID=UPI003AAE8C4E